MGSTPTTATARLLPLAAAAFTFAALLAFGLAAPAPASATSVADAARALAADSQRLADAQNALSNVSDELHTNDDRQHKMRAQIEARLVSIYKYGGGGSPITQAAAIGNVRDASNSLDTLDLVAKHDQQAIQRWQKLVHRQKQLTDRRAKLNATIAKAQRDVEHGRKRLSNAYAAVAKARAEIEKMSRAKPSPVVPSAVSPETTVARATLGGSATAPQPVGVTQSGIASTYADNFAGQLTSNGERYDPNAFTAASLTLPLGTWVNVTGPGGSVAVRINDRGPYVGGRIIDLSRAAAAAVGLMGVGSVTLSVSS